MALQSSVHGCVGLVPAVGNCPVTTMLDPFRFAVHLPGAFVHDAPRHAFRCRTVMATACPAFRARAFPPAFTGPMQIVSPGGGSDTTPVPGAAGTRLGSMAAAGVAAAGAASTAG